MTKYYPWGGDFTSVNAQGSVAVVVLNTDFVPTEQVAIYGRLKTENIGIEKIIANVISNPHIRYVMIVGNDIRGHQSGRSLIALHQNGLNSNHRIINAPGAIPFIENLNGEAVLRFQNQVEIIDLIGETDDDSIHDQIQNVVHKKTECFGEPFIAIQLKKQRSEDVSDKRAIHSKIVIDYLGHVKKRE